MDINNITQVIASLGFPIAAYVGLFWYIVQKDKEHKEETTTLKTAIDNNTLVLTKLVERLNHEQ